MRGKSSDGITARNGASIEERLALHSHLDQETNCLLWTGAPHDSFGYCRMGIAGRMQYVHRVAWELVNGNVPKDKVLRHSCDRPNCINVEHLSLGSQKENVADIYARGRAANLKGERNNSAKLTFHKVRLMRAYAKNGASVKELSILYGVCKTQVRNVLLGTHWKETA